MVQSYIDGGQSPLADSPVKYFLLLSAQPVPGHSPLHYLHNMSLSISLNEWALDCWNKIHDLALQTKIQDRWIHIWSYICQKADIWVMTSMISAPWTSTSSSPALFSLSTAHSDGDTSHKFPTCSWLRSQDTGPASHPSHLCKFSERGVGISTDYRVGNQCKMQVNFSYIHCKLNSFCWIRAASSMHYIHTSLESMEQLMQYLKWKWTSRCYLGPIFLGLVWRLRAFTTPRSSITDHFFSYTSSSTLHSYECLWVSEWAEFQY